jgi:glycosyltransferase involved in cell wall biosynthesis
VKVLVVIPAYNAETTIQAAIHSVLDQRGVEARIVVVDHGSSDRTPTIVARYAEAGLLDFLSLQRQAREKRSASRPLERGIRHGLEMAADPSRLWFMRLDADDVLADHASIGSLLDDAGKSRLLVGRLIFFDEVSGFAETYTVAPQYRSRDSLLHGAAYSTPHHAALVRFDLLAAVLESRGFAFDHRIGYGEDLDLTFALVAACAPNEIVFRDRDVCFKRLDGRTISRTAPRTSVALDHIRVLHRHKLLFGELAWRAAIDLAMQQLHLFDSPIRRRFGFPGRRWASMQAVPPDDIYKRLRSLNAMAMAV